MKRRTWLIPVILLAALLLTLGGLTVSKYVKELREDPVVFSAATFYFQSNVMTEEAEPTPLAVNGRQGTVTLTNGMDNETFSNVDVTYTLSYYVQIDSAWVEVILLDGVWTAADGTTPKTELTLTGNAFDSHPVDISPIDYNGTTYDDVKVVATSTGPYTKTLCVRMQFSYSGYTLKYAYDNEVGMVTLSVSTNDDEGEFVISWQEHLLPDNADPNGILTAGLAGPDSVTATLEAHTTYNLLFFVDSTVREEVDNALSGMTEDEILEELAKAVTCVKS